MDFNANDNDEEFVGNVNVFLKVDDELRGVSEEIKDLKCKVVTGRKNCSTHARQRNSRNYFTFRKDQGLQ